MKPSPKRAAIAVLLAAALCLKLTLWHENEKAEVSTADHPAAAATATATSPTAPVPSLPTPPKVAAAQAPAQAPQPEAETYVAGHFPGVSVRHLPGTHRPTPPEGSPRTPARIAEVVLPDGQTLIGASVDESWRVPVQAAEAKP